MKECSRCKETKDLMYFSIRKESKDGYKGVCNPCANERRRATTDTTTREYHRNWNLQANYGMTSCDVEEVMKFQGSRCAICSTPADAEVRGLFVDHCHETGEVRGMLCNACNSLLGHAKDNTDTLEEAVRYLNAFKD